MAVTARDAQGQVIAELRPGHPCRATIGPVDMQIGGSPLVAQVGDARWSGETRPNGTTLAKNGTAVARVETRGAEVDVWDPRGIAMVKITVADGAATVADAASRLVRRVSAKAGALSIDSPPVTVTGTTDPALAALLTAPELPPEVRMLAACERVL